MINPLADSRFSNQTCVHVAPSSTLISTNGVVSVPRVAKSPRKRLIWPTVTATS